MAKKRTDDPFKVLAAIRLRPMRWRRNQAERILDMPVTDYEIIFAQHFEIMRLRAELDGRA